MEQKIKTGTGQNLNTIEMVQSTFKRKFKVEVLKKKKHPKPYDYLYDMELKVTNVANKRYSTYYWSGNNNQLIVNEGDLDMDYLEGLISRGQGGGQDFVDIVEEYVMNELI